LRLTTLRVSPLVTPSRLLFIDYQRAPNVDVIKEHLEEKDTIERDLESIREGAGKNILKSQEYN